jgi:hypothetical protein
MTAHALATLSLIGFSNVLGTFVGRLLGHLLGQPPARVSRMAEEGGFIAVGVALSCWIVLNAIDSL